MAAALAAAGGGVGCGMGGRGMTGEDEAGGEGTPRHSRGCASGARAARRRSSTKRRGSGGGALPCGGGGVSTKRCNR